MTVERCFTIAQTGWRKLSQLVSATAVIATALFLVQASFAGKVEQSGLDPVAVFKYWEMATVGQLADWNPAQTDEFLNKRIQIIGQVDAIVSTDADIGGPSQIEEYRLAGFKGGFFPVRFTGSRPMPRDDLYILGVVQLDHKGSAYINEVKRFRVIGTDSEKLREWVNFQTDRPDIPDPRVRALAYALENCFRRYVAVCPFPMPMRPFTKGEWDRGARTSIDAIERHMQCDHPSDHRHPDVDVRPASIRVRTPDGRESEVSHGGSLDLPRGRLFVSAAGQPSVEGRYNVARDGDVFVVAATSILPDDLLNIVLIGVVVLLIVVVLAILITKTNKGKVTSTPPPPPPPPPLPPQPKKTKIESDETKVYEGGLPLDPTTTRVLCGYHLEVLSGGRDVGKKLLLGDDTLIGRDCMNYDGLFVKLDMSDRTELAVHCSRHYARIKLRENETGVFDVEVVNTKRNPVVVDGKQIRGRGETAEAREGSIIELMPDWKFQIKKGIG